MSEICDCYEKHRKNRSTKKRGYTIADLNRISVYVNRDEKIQPLFIIAELAYFHGYGTYFCKVYVLIQKLRSAWTFVQPILTTLATAKLLRWLQVIATGGTIATGGFLSFMLVFSITATLVISFAEKIIGWFEWLLGDATLQQIEQDSKMACQYLRSKYGESVGEIITENYDFSLTSELADFVMHKDKELSIIQNDDGTFNLGLFQ